MAVRMRPLLRLADRLERAGTLVVMCLFFAVGAALIFFGLDRAGPYFRLIPPELPLGVILALAGFAIPTQFAHLAAQLRAHADTLLRREGLTTADLPSDDQ